MTTTPNPSNVPADIKKVETDESQLETDTATLAADDAAPPVVTPPPAVPVPVAPAAPTATVSGTSVDFGWATVANATEYKLVLDGVTLSGFTSVGGWEQTGMANGSHTVAVYGVNSAGVAGPKSPVTTFAVGTTPVTPPPVTPPPVTGVAPTINAGQKALTTVPTNVLFNSTWEGVGGALGSQWSPYWGKNGGAQEPNTESTNSANVTVTTAGVNLQCSGPAVAGLICTADSGQAEPFTFTPSPAKPVFVEFKAYIPCNSAGKINNWPALWIVTPGVWNGEVDIFEGLGGGAAAHTHIAGGNQGAINYSIIPNADNVFGLLYDNSGSVCQLFVNGVSQGNLSCPAISASTLAETKGYELVAENSGGADSGPLANTTVILRYARVFQ